MLLLPTPHRPIARATPHPAPPHHPTSRCPAAHRPPRSPEQASRGRRLCANAPVKTARVAIPHLVSRADLHRLELLQALGVHLHTRRLHGKTGARRQTMTLGWEGLEHCALSWVLGRRRAVGVPFFHAIRVHAAACRMGGGYHARDAAGGWVLKARVQTVHRRAYFTGLDTSLAVLTPATKRAQGAGQLAAVATSMRDMSLRRSFFCAFFCCFLIARLACGLKRSASSERSCCLASRAW